ncbi:MAG: response regulator [Desulfobacteraceae bacterium]|nr:response regulator [Desulfobacteraceae bacterium]
MKKIAGVAGVFNKLPLKKKLVFTYLLISIIPFILISILLFNFFIDTLEQQAFNQLQSIRNIKKTQVEDFFEQLKAQTDYFVGNIGRDQMGPDNTAVVAHLMAFKADAKTLSDSPLQRRKIIQQLFVPGSEDKPTKISGNRDFYDYTHEDRHPFQKNFVDTFGYEDLYLVSEEGDIVYSVKKEKNFGTNLLDGPYAKTALGKAFSHAKSESKDKNKFLAPAGKSLYFSDFERVGDGIYAYISIPLFDYGKFQGAVIYSISIDRLNRILNERSGLGKTGETYLVGQDHLMRSEGYRQPYNYSIEAVQQGRRNWINTRSVDAALSGKTYIHETTSYLGDEVLSAYAPVSVFGQRWALVTEISQKEAFARIHQWFFIVIGIALAIVIIIIIIGYFVANTIAKPVIDLTRMAEKIAAGDWGISIDNKNPKSHDDQNEIIYSQDELARLATSFEQMRYAICDKMNQIERQNEELKKLDEFKNDLLANTTHELKTPLSGIIGLTESLLGQIPERYNKTLNNIINSGRRLSNLVNDILDASKLKQKEIRISPKSLNLRQIVDFDISISTSLIGDKPVVLVNDVPDYLCVAADQHRLQQIFQNLVGNAVKFTDQGEIRICAKTIDGDLVEVSVCDTGIGIQAEDQKRIFKAFEQSESAANRSYEGTGLGLSITRQLVKLHGGNIRVESESAKGACFFFTLPISSEQSETLQQVVPQAVEFNPVENSPQLIQGKEKEFIVLAVDDEPINLDIISNHLENSPCHIQLVSSGAEAIAFMETRKPDLILLDVMMPEMDGYTVCEKLREQFSAYDLPIIFLTARNQIRDLVKGFNAGANDYLTKPFFKDELLARVKIQIELLINRERINKLWQFSNTIGTFKSHEEMVGATHDLLNSDPLIEGTVQYFEGKKVMDTPENLHSQLFDEYPEGLEKNSEVIITKAQMVIMFVKLSRQYSLGALFPKSSSEDWMRTLVIQAHKNMEQIRRIIADPENALVQSNILPMLDQILYIKVEKNYCLLFRQDDDIVLEDTLRIPFKQVLFHTENHQLFQIHRSYAINPSKIISVSTKDQLVYLENDEAVPVAKKYLALLKKEYPGAGNITTS